MRMESSVRLMYVVELIISPNELAMINVKQLLYILRQWQSLICLDRELAYLYY